MPRFRKEQLPELAADFEAGASVRELGDKYNLGNRALLRHLVQAREQDLLDDLSRLRVDETVHDFPENPETRLEAILSSMNSELKQATILMLDRNPRTCSSLRSKLAELTSADIPVDRTIGAYCSHTLSSIGFLVQERYGAGLRLEECYFTLSEPGERYGQPIAAFSLRYAVDHNISLYELLGPSVSSGDSRAPYNRTRIVELVEKGCDTMIELENQLGLGPHGVYKHLKQLQKLDLLTLDSLNLEKGSVKTYAWVEGKLPEEARTVGTYRSLTKAVARWLFENRIGDRKRIAHELNYKHLRNISQVLVGLVKQGLADTNFVGQRSKITLHERSMLLTDCTQSIRALDKGELRNMESMLNEFRQDTDKLKEYLDAGIELYNRVSPMINARTAKEREAHLLKFIQNYQAEHGIGARPTEMESALGWNIASVAGYIRILFENGQLTREKNAGAARYSIAE